MQLFTICFCNIFAPKNQKKTKSEYQTRKKSKLDGLQKNKTKKEE